MLTVYHVPRTRSVRVIWLCYELDLPLHVETIDFSAEARANPEWRARSPAGKVPALSDGDLTMFESGAIVDYILEKYGAGRLHPPPGTAESAIYRQWCWFAEATLSRFIGDVAQHTILRPGNERIPAVAADGKARARLCLEGIEERLVGDYLLGDTFTAADIMMGWSVMFAEAVGILDASLPRVTAYLERLKARPALQEAIRA